MLCAPWNVSSVVHKRLWWWWWRRRRRRITSRSSDGRVKESKRWICRVVFFPDSNFQHNSLHLPCPLWTRQPAWKENSGGRWAPLGLCQRMSSGAVLKNPPTEKQKHLLRKTDSKDSPFFFTRLNWDRNPIYGMRWFVFFIHPFIYLLEIWYIICRFNLKFVGIS